MCLLREITTAESQAGGSYHWPAGPSCAGFMHSSHLQQRQRCTVMNALRHVESDHIRANTEKHIMPFCIVHCEHSSHVAACTGAIIKRLVMQSSPPLSSNNQCRVQGSRQVCPQPQACGVLDQSGSRRLPFSCRVVVCQVHALDTALDAKSQSQLMPPCIAMNVSHHDKMALSEAYTKRHMMLPWVDAGEANCFRGSI